MRRSRYEIRATTSRREIAIVAQANAVVRPHRGKGRTQTSEARQSGLEKIRIVAEMRAGAALPVRRSAAHERSSHFCAAI